MEDLDPTAQLIIDGTLLQCWSWKDHSELYSGKHKTTGLNVQVACTWGAWCFSDWGSFSSRESIGWIPCQQRDTPRSC